jgi:tryptophan-rich sensory protein
MSKLVIAYVLLCAAAIAYIIWSGVFAQGRIELAGIAIVLLGLPWSLIVTFAVLLVHSSSAWLLAIGYILSCVLNGYFLYKFGRSPSSRPR